MAMVSMVGNMNEELWYPLQRYILELRADFEGDPVDFPEYLLNEHGIVAKGFIIAFPDELVTYFKLAQQ